MSPIALCPICRCIARRIDAATVWCHEHGTVAQRSCCMTYLGQAHAEGCLAPVRALLARARAEVYASGLLSDDEIAPLLCPRGVVSVAALSAASALDGTADRLRTANADAWLIARAEARVSALVLAEELRASATAGRAEA